MKNKSKHIIINSPANLFLAQAVAKYLVKEYGFVLTSEDSFSTLTEGVHGVSVETSNTISSTNNKYVANLTEFSTTNAENLSGYIFEDASDHFIGNLSEEELLACA